ncbi:hypothetical protein Hanom_Chr06g00566631 [Helianthus anomalus]
MCMSWNTENGKRSTKQGEKIARMTYVVIQAGQWGMMNTAATWKKIKGKNVGFAEVLLHTHTTKECKKRLHDGEINANDYDKLEFVTNSSKRSYVSYMKKLERVYGNTNCDDMEVWESLHPECQGRKLFRVGSSDPHFVLSGTTSSIASIPDARQSHEVLLLLLSFGQCFRASRTGLGNHFFRHRKECICMYVCVLNNICNCV